MKYGQADSRKDGSADNTSSSDSDGSDEDTLKPLKEQKELFDHLTAGRREYTDWDVITVTVVNDDQHCLVMENDKEQKNCRVRLVDLEHPPDYDEDESEVGSVKETVKNYQGDYVKMNQIQCSHDGEYYAIAYQDSGRFYVSVLDSELREHDNLIDVSNILELDEESKPIELFDEPGMTAVFLLDDTLFIQVYHRF